METSLILLVVVEMGVIKYKNPQQVCKQIMTLIIEEYIIVALMRYAWRTKIRIESQGTCSKHSAETTCYDKNPSFRLKEVRASTYR